jgi:hypothetical protein
MEKKMINRLKTKEFHFVLNNALKEKIKEISKIFKFSISKTIVFMLENTEALISKIHLLSSEENNKVEDVNWDMHMHVYLTEDKKKYYNRLKSIHKDCNTYSIACKLRYLLKIFIKGVELFGIERFLEVLKKSKEKWEKRMKNKSVWYKKKKERQLNIYPHLEILYSTDYTVILIKLLNLT